MTSQPLYLSPSENHAHLLRQVSPRLAYTGGPLDPWRDELRATVRQLIGLPELDRPPLNVRALWREEGDAGTIEKIAFTSEPYADIIAYFCVPRGLSAPYPTIICLQGHGTGVHFSIARDNKDENKSITVEDDHDYAISAMHNGFAALCIEQRSFGFRHEQVQEKVNPHGCHDAVMQALMLGRTLVGERVFDVDRGIDYLTERGDVDLSRLGLMGFSGGGTVTIYAAAVLERIQFALAAGSVCTFADSIMSISHCGDNYVPNILRYAEQADIIGLFAPKPLVMVSGADDPIFPIHGVRHAVEQVSRIYAAAGAPENCRLVVGPGGHRFFAEPAWRALREVLAGASKGSSR